MKFIQKILAWGTLVSTSGFILCTLVQIVARFLLPSSPSWTEEASRIFFIYAISFSAGFALKDRQYVFLDILFSRLNIKQQRWLNILIGAATLILFMILGLFSLPLIQMGMTERSPSLGIPMAYAFLSLLVMALSVSLYAWAELLAEIKQTT